MYTLDPQHLPSTMRKAILHETGRNRIKLNPTASHKAIDGDLPKEGIRAYIRLDQSRVRLSLSMPLRTYRKKANRQSIRPPFFPYAFCPPLDRLRAPGLSTQSAHFIIVCTLGYIVYEGRVRVVVVVVFQRRKSIPLSARI